MKCPFCDKSKLEIIMENDLAFVIYDKYPVNRGHCLVIPKRHAETWFDATAEEKRAIIELIDELKRFLDEKFSPDGYNIGVNVGSAAGQTIFHLHVHVIPRYKGDIKDPTGGVRGVIPAKRIYKSG